MTKKKKLVQGRRRSKLVQGGEEFEGRKSRESMRIPAAAAAGDLRSIRFDLITVCGGGHTN
jgi:hypothetical protein